MFNLERLKQIAVPQSKEAIQAKRERKLKRLMKKKFINYDTRIINKIHNHVGFVDANIVIKKFLKDIKS